MVEEEIRKRAWYEVLYISSCNNVETIILNRISTTWSQQISAEFREFPPNGPFGKLVAKCWFHFTQSFWYRFYQPSFPLTKLIDVPILK